MIKLRWFWIEWRLFTSNLQTCKKPKTIMIEFIDSVLPFVFIITAISFIIFFIIGVGLTIQYGKEGFEEYFGQTKLGKPSAIISVIGIILIFSFLSLVKKLARTEISEALVDLENIELNVNGKLIKNDSLILDIKNIKSESDARNTGSPKINLRILSNKKYFHLRFVRSSYDKELYWVFYPEYKSTDDNCIGEIRTKQLNDIKQ
jgi:uncharacterized membrane protein